MDQHVRDAFTESVDTVRLVIPPSSDYLRTARLVAADASVRAGLDCEEIEDFRIAVDELCHHLMSCSDNFVELHVVTTPRAVIARGLAISRAGAESRVPGELSSLILAATTDHYEVANRGDEMSFTILKQTRRVLADRR